MNKLVKYVAVGMIFVLTISLMGCTKQTNSLTVNNSEEIATQNTSVAVEETSASGITVVPDVDPDATAERSDFVLGTIITVSLKDHGSEALLDLIFEALKDIENRMSVTIATSEVAKINAQAGKEPVKVSSDTFEIIKAGIRYGELTQGKFDIALGPIIQLWQIGTDFAHVPLQSEIDEALAHVDFHKIILDEANQTVMLQDEGMEIDLGGIAKGYSADYITQLLKANAVEKAIINLGGNVFAYGSKGEGKYWQIGIQSPFEDRNNYIGIVSVNNETVVTSGPYERYFMDGDKRYHHIFDNTTGYPVDNQLASVSIIGSSSMDADALSTSVYALGIEAGLALINSLENVQCIIVDNDKNIYLSQGIKERFELTETDYTIKN